MGMGTFAHTCAVNPSTGLMQAEVRDFPIREAYQLSKAFSRKTKQSRVKHLSSVPGSRELWAHSVSLGETCPEQ